MKLAKIISHRRRVFFGILLCALISGPNLKAMESATLPVFDLIQFTMRLDWRISEFFKHCGFNWFSLLSRKEETRAHGALLLEKMIDEYQIAKLDTRETENLALDLMEWFVSHNFLKWQQNITLEQAKQLFEKERKTGVILKAEGAECLLSCTIAKSLPFAQGKKEAKLNVKVSQETLLFFKQLLYAYYNHKEIEHRGDFIAPITAFIEKRFGGNLYDLELLSRATLIDELIQATTLEPVTISARDGLLGYPLDKRLADFFKNRGYYFQDIVRQGLSKGMLFALKALCEHHDLEKTFKEDDGTKKELAVDIAEWVLNNDKAIEILMTKTDKSQAAELIVQTFKAESTKGFILKNKIDNGVKVVIPLHVAAFFPFLKVKMSGDFSDSNMLLLDQPYDQETLSSFKQLLCVYYRMCLLERVSYDASNNGHNNNPLIAKLRNALVGLNKDGKVSTDLLELADAWGIHSLFQALGNVLKEQEEDAQREVIKTMPLSYLTHLARNMENADYVAGLLSLMLKEKMPVSKDVMSECCEQFSNNLYRIENCHAAVDLSPELEEMYKQILIQQHHIPNYMLIWDLPEEKGAMMAPVINAWRNGEEVYFLHSDGRLSAYHDAADDYKHSRPIRILDTHPQYTCALSLPGDKDRFLAGNREGLVTVNERDVKSTVIKEDNHSAVTALAFHTIPFVGTNFKIIHGSYYFAFAHANGAVGLFKETPETTRSGNYVTMLRDSELNGKPDYCYMMAMGINLVYAVFDSGTIKVWDVHTAELVRTFSVPLGANDRVTKLSVTDDSLFVAGQQGVVFIIDLAKMKEPNATQISMCKAVLADKNSSNYGKAVTALEPMYFPYVAVGYDNGRICIWNLETKKVCKTFTTAGKAIGLCFRNGILESISSRGLVERRFFPECAELSEVIQVIRTKDLGN